MIREDEGALICDLAETYHIYDYKQLPLTQVAIFANGLRDDSRINMKLSNQTISMDTMLLGGIMDRLNLLLWSRTKDGQKGINRPTMVADALTHRGNKTRENNNVIVFNSGEDFENTRNEILKAGGD